MLMQIVIGPCQSALMGVLLWPPALSGGKSPVPSGLNGELRQTGHLDKQSEQPKAALFAPRTSG